MRSMNVNDFTVDLCQCGWTGRGFSLSLSFCMRSESSSVA